MTERAKTYRFIAPAGGERKRPFIAGTLVAFDGKSSGPNGSAWRSFLERLVVLATEGENEGIHIAEASEHDLKYFLSTHRFPGVPTFRF